MREETTSSAPWPILAMALAAVAALASLLWWLGLAGPWPVLTLVAAATAALAAALAVRSQRALARAATDQAQRLRDAEQALEQSRQELHKHAALESELTRAKQDAEAAAMAKGEFLATMSHEIRTPLNGILPMLELLARGPLAEDQRQMLRTAWDSSQQMLRIVDDILDYSKLEANRVELEITSFNLRELLEGVVQLMGRNAQDKGLKLTLQIEPGVRLAVRGDPVRLRQVIGNLLSNAIKFTAHGHIDIHVSRRGETADQHLLRFEVRDTGIGIGTEQQAHLFEAFTQADASTTRLYGGTGLGLSISKRIVDLMHGSIGVQSEPGKGSLFWIDVPLLKVPGDQQQVANSAHRVLLIAASKDEGNRLRQMMRDWPLQLEVAHSHQEGLACLRAATPPEQPCGFDTVLADLETLGTGAEALQRVLGKTPAYRRIRLLWLADALPEALKQAGAEALPRRANASDLHTWLLPEQAALPALAPDTGTDAPERPALPGAATEEAPQALVGARLLLVEDNPVNLAVGRQLLASLGYRADCAENGEQALVAMNGTRYDLVLLDCQMPGVDGYTVARRWRAKEAQDEVATPLPIIAMTANAMAGDRERCLDAGMSDYLSKPLARDILGACLQRWLERRATTGAAATAAAPDDNPPPSQAALEPPSTPQPGVPRGDEPTGDALASAPATGAAQTAVARDARTEAAGLGNPAGQMAPADIEDASQALIQAFAAPEPAPSVPVPSASRHAIPAVATAPVAPASTTAEDSAPVLDPSVLDELYEFAGKEADTILELFLADAPRQVELLEQAATARDIARMGEIAHSLKSAAANVGAMALSAVAARIEAEARSGTLAMPDVAVALVIAESARMRVAIAGYRLQHRGDA